MQNLTEQSRRFMKYLLVTGLIWWIAGAALHASSIADLIGFTQVFLFIFLDLIFLILIFWRVFFTPITLSSRVPQILLFVFFKLVCLGFLAITLKRLRNAPISVIMMGVGFLGFGPLIAGWFSQKKHKD
jgi:drug/metabolite transporter (DMT)-like permease